MLPIIALKTKVKHFETYLAVAKVFGDGGFDKFSGLSLSREAQGTGEAHVMCLLFQAFLEPKGPL